MTHRSFYANHVGLILFGGLFVSCSPMVSQLSNLAKESPATDQVSLDDEFERAQPPAQIAGVSLTFVCEDQEEMDMDFVHLLCFFADSTGNQYTGDVDLSAVKLVSAAGNIEHLSFSTVDVGLAYRYEVAVPVALIKEGVGLEAAYSVAGADVAPVDPAEAPQGDSLPDVKADPPMPTSTTFVLKPATVAKAKDSQDVGNGRDAGGERENLKHSNCANATPNERAMVGKLHAGKGASKHKKECD